MLRKGTKDVVVPLTFLHTVVCKHNMVHQEPKSESMSLFELWIIGGITGRLLIPVTC